MSINETQATLETHQERCHERSSQQHPQEFNTLIPFRTRQDTAHLSPCSGLPPSNATSSHIDEKLDQPQLGSDPRSSSTQSLVPIKQRHDGRRTLLLVYIHGFMGTETSFKEFPAHVHKILTIMVAESHVVHSKIYPRYKSRRAMEYVRDDFSQWISPHESSDTDLILLGHSLGGILAAEVALKAPSLPGGERSFEHRILGIVNFDVPFLGLHPGVIPSGISSLFRQKEKSTHTQDQPNNGSLAGAAQLSNLQISAQLADHELCPLTLRQDDPNFDPDFPNDVRLAQRSQIDGALNFIFKNADHLVKATKQYIVSHVEFGSCLADYPGLKRRYRRIRELEDVDEYSNQRDSNGRLLQRVRFVNYYTAATGRIKSPIPFRGSRDDAATIGKLNLKNYRHSPNDASGQLRSLSVSRSIENETEVQRRENTNGTSHSDACVGASNQEALGYTTETVSSVSEETPTVLVQEDSGAQLGPMAASQEPLPPIPPCHCEPSEFDLSQYLSKDFLKQAQKDYSNQIKDHKKANKDRDKEVKAFENLITKQEKASVGTSPGTQASPSSSFSSPPLMDYISDHPPNNEISDRNVRGPTTPPQLHKRKFRKFCALPPNDTSGERDPLWVRVYMEGMDEVAAHQSLFFPSAAYERLVGDVASRIGGWVQDDLTRRVVIEETLWSGETAR